MLKIFMGLFAIGRAGLWFSTGDMLLGAISTFEASAWFVWFVLSLSERRYEMQCEIERAGCKVASAEWCGVVYVSGDMSIADRRRIEDRFDVVIIKGVQ